MARLVRVIGILLAFTFNHSEKTFSQAPPFDAKLLQLLWSPICPSNWQLVILRSSATVTPFRQKEAPEVRAKKRLLYSDIRKGPTPISTPPGLI